jgi:RNA polymerase sigma-70 factor (ECF subfamily)
MACVPDTDGTAETSDRTVGELSDEQLISRIRRRDQAAFACYLGRHLDTVHGYLYRLTGSRADADDLSQDTFLRVWRKAATYKPGRVKPSTWLHRIAHNLCVDQFRKRARASTETYATADESAPPPADLEARQAIERLNTAMHDLPESQRSALLLCQVQGFSNLEAASILGISVRALESLLARARRTLKAELADHR